MNADFAGNTLIDAVDMNTPEMLKTACEAVEAVTFKGATVAPATFAEKVALTAGLAVEPEPPITSAAIPVEELAICTEVAAPVFSNLKPAPAVSSVIIPAPVSPDKLSKFPILFYAPFF